MWRSAGECSGKIDQINLILGLKRLLAKSMLLRVMKHAQADGPSV